MKKASIGEAQHNLKAVLEYVTRGEEVLLTRRNKVVAKIVPPVAEDDTELPTFFERAKLMFPDVKGIAVSEVILDDRNERT